MNAEVALLQIRTQDTEESSNYTTTYNILEIRLFYLNPEPTRMDSST